MKKLTILNDLHIGAVRTAGTTEASKWQLRMHLSESLTRLLPTDGDLMLLGDLFDQGQIPSIDLLRTFNTLSNWLAKDTTAKLYNVAGNHDLNKVSNVMSSFQLLGELLKQLYPEQYVHIEEPMMTPYGYVIPHVRNQDVFNLELSRVPECDYLFLHCNYDNFFATHSDQSLNLSKEQSAESKAKHIIIAHEHHAKRVPKVTIPGNQMASSISDWLTPGDKGYVCIVDGVLSHHISAKRDDEYAEIDWKTLGDSTAKFIRVVGTASSDEIGTALTSINRYRAQSSALVITNAVATQAEASIVESFSTSLESVQKFSIVDALKRNLTEDEFKIVEPFTHA